MAKKETQKAPVNKSDAHDDLVGALAKITCDYPDWPSEDLAAFHLFKHEILSATYRFYLNVSPKRASGAVKDVFGKVFATVKLN